MKDNAMQLDVLEEAINTLSTGSAICFIGAGFGLDAKDQSGNSVPSTEQLAQEICGLIGIPRGEGGSLSDLADFCENDETLASKLQQLLLSRLTLCVPSKSQETILRAPWRSIFTTNFDDIAERALDPAKPQIITPTTDAKDIVGEKLPIYYLHGRALDIIQKKGNPRLVLSESNYLNLKSRNTNLHAALLNEIHCANKVFFIGYSLRDMEIAQHLFSISEVLRSKTVVICGSNEGKVALSRLQKFGQVFPIGVDGLSSKLPDNFEKVASDKASKRLAFVTRIQPVASAATITSDDIDRLIISGEFDFSKFAVQKTLGNDQDLYCVERSTRLNEVFDSVSKGINRIVVSSDIGNGKTIFLDQLSFSGLARGYEVFRVNSRLPEAFKELEYLLKRTTRQMFLIDDLVRNRKIIEFIGARLSGLSVLVCASRDPIDAARYSEITTAVGGQFREIDLDSLTAEELVIWDKLLERWGIWEQKIAHDTSARIRFLKESCGSENRSIVVSVFKSSHVSQKIKAIVSYFLKSKPEHTTAFVALLICSLCQKHVEWDLVVQWLKIDERQLKRDLQSEAIFNFMSGHRDWHRLTSTQLADHIFRNYEFDDELLVHVYTNIVKETAYSANDPRSGFDSTENLKELMKFRFLTRIFGDGPSAHSSIEAIYRRLSSVPRIRENDQFWLQFAMSHLETEETEEAEKYIETALGIARKRGMDYSTHQILDQRARLYLLKNAKKPGHPNTNELSTALTDLETLLRREGSDVYPLRASNFILRLLEEKCDLLDQPMRERMLKLLSDMNVAVRSGSLRKTQRGEKNSLRDSIQKAILILKNV
jgi:hypothetical protein